MTTIYSSMFLTVTLIEQVFKIPIKQT